MSRAFVFHLGGKNLRELRRAFFIILLNFTFSASSLSFAFSSSGVIPDEFSDNKITRSVYVEGPSGNGSQISDGDLDVEIYEKTGRCWRREYFIEKSGRSITGIVNYYYKNNRQARSSINGQILSDGTVVFITIPDSRIKLRRKGVNFAFIGVVKENKIHAIEALKDCSFYMEIEVD